MAIHVSLSQKGNSKNPDSLQNGHLLQVSSVLRGLVPIVEQIEDPTGQYDALRNSLKAAFGDSKVTDDGPQNPFVYKYEWDEVDGWRRICCWVGNLAVTFSNASVVSVSFMADKAFAESNAAVAAP